MTIPEYDICQCGKRGPHSECNPAPADQIDGEIKQILYAHGGSRIYAEDGRKRRLLADTYENEEYSLAVFEFTKNWFAKDEERRRFSR